VSQYLRRRAQAPYFLQTCMVQASCGRWKLTLTLSSSSRSNSLLPLHNSLPYCEGNDSAACAEAMLKSLKVEGLGNSWYNTTRQLPKSLVTPQNEAWRPEPAVDFFLGSLLSAVIPHNCLIWYEIPPLSFL